MNHGQRVERLERKNVNPKLELHYGNDVFEELAHYVVEMFKERCKREPTDAEVSVIAERLPEASRISEPDKFAEFALAGF